MGFPHSSDLGHAAPALGAHPPPHGQAPRLPPDAPAPDFLREGTLLLFSTREGFPFTHTVWMWSGRALKSSPLSNPNRSHSRSPAPAGAPCTCCLDPAYPRPRCADDRTVSRHGKKTHSGATEPSGGRSCRSRPRSRPPPVQLWPGSIHLDPDPLLPRFPRGRHPLNPLDAAPPFSGKEALSARQGV